MISRYYKELLGFCTRVLKDRDAAADLVQETYSRFLAAEHAGEHIQTPRAFLYRMARNLIIDEHRHNRVRNTQSLDELPDEALADIAHVAQSHPEADYSAMQYTKAMSAAIDSLPPRCREAFVMSRFDGLSHQEIAESMGISKNMVAQHIIRGMLTCKAYDDAFHGRVKTAPPP